MVRNSPGMNETYERVSANVRPDWRSQDPGMAFDPSTDLD